MSAKRSPTGVERRLDPNSIIVSKTDLRGVITYANRTFIEIAGYDEEELLGRPHSIIRHPAMPRCVFQLLWSELASGREVFAYVVNLCKNGDHYWVLAHVTPDRDPASGAIVGYHSSRRAPSRRAIASAEALYAQLLAVEAGHGSKRDAMAASSAALTQTLGAKGLQYHELVFSL